MLLNKKSPYLNQILVLFAAVLLAYGCAVPQKPQGGPKDVAPPKLLKETPANQTKNFSSKKIVLEFDEYFRLANQYQEINISPASDKLPEFKVRGKSLEIEIKDTLLKETTYKINFGKAIADVNEGNTLNNYIYVFSTGNEIDSLKISGTVKNNSTQEIEKDVTVMLFSLKQDSLLFGKKKPTIFATTDTAGNFTLSNLHAGSYKLYALKEATGGNRIYDNEKELIAFPGKVINLTKDTGNIKLNLFQEVPVAFRFIERRFDENGRIFFSFNKSLNNPSIKIIEPAALDAQKYIDINKTRDSAYLFMRTMDFDSLKIEIADNNVPLDTTILRKARKETFKPVLLISTNADKGNLLKPGIDLQITTNSPITNRFPSLITLKENDVLVTGYTISPDPADNKRLTLKYRWKPDATYMLTFSEGALIGFFSEKNGSVSKKFKLDKPTNYTNMTLKVSLPDTSRSYVVELLNDQGDKTIRSNVITKGTTLKYENYPTGKYKVRVIYDTNRNGKWDSGSVKENRQPENSWIHPKTIIMRPNFESEEPLDVPKEPTP